jgi:hypothetical protein
MAIPTADSTLAPHLTEMFSIVGPLFAVIIGLVAWAWRSMEKNIDRLENAIKDHGKDDIAVHNTIFDQIRICTANHDTLKDVVAANKSKLSKLEGEHKVYHGDTSEE